MFKCRSKLPAVVTYSGFGPADSLLLSCLSSQQLLIRKYYLLTSNVIFSECTWFKKYDGLEASKLCGVDVQFFEAVHDGLQLVQGSEEAGLEVGELGAGEDGG